MTPPGGDWAPTGSRKDRDERLEHFRESLGVLLVTYVPGDSPLDHTPTERLQLPVYDPSIEVLTEECPDLIDS